MKKVRLLLTVIAALLVAVAIPATVQANSYDTAPDLGFTGQWTDFQNIGTDEEMWYKVTVPSDGEFEMRVMNYSNESLKSELLSQDLSTTFFTDYMDYGSDTSPVTTVCRMPLVKGTYYLKLYNYLGEPVKFKMKNTFTSYGVNDTAAYSFDSPQIYTVGTTITGLTGVADPEDWFKVVITKEGTYTLSTKNYFKEPLKIDIRNSDSSESVWLGYCSGYYETPPNVGSDTITLPPGTYYIKMYYDWGRGGKYSFTLTAPPAPPAPACSHEYTYTTVDPTYFAQGYTKYTCTKCGNTFNSDYKAKKKLAKVKITSAKAKKKSVSLKWRKVKAASGYQIKYSTKKSMKKAKIRKLKNKNAKGLTIKKLKSKKTYYIQVRAYKNISGKTVYGKWSAKKKVKIK